MYTLHTVMLTTSLHLSSPTHYIKYLVQCTHVIGLIRVNYHADVFKPGYTENASAPQHKKPVRTVRYPGVIFEDTIITRNAAAFLLWMAAQFPDP